MAATVVTCCQPSGVPSKVEGDREVPPHGQEPVGKILDRVGEKKVGPLDAPLQRAPAALRQEPPVEDFAGRPGVVGCRGHGVPFLKLCRETC